MSETAERVARIVDRHGAMPESLVLLRLMAGEGGAALSLDEARCAVRLAQRLGIVNTEAVTGAAGPWITRREVAP